MPVSSWSEVLAEDLARRSRVGVLAYAGLAIIVAASSSLAHAHPTTAASFCVGTVTIGLPRLWLSVAFRKIYPSHPRAWLRAFRIAAWTAGAYWGVGAAFALHAGSSDEALVVLASTAGIAAGAATSLAGDKLLVAIYLASLLAPLTAVEVASGSMHHVGIAAAVGLFYAFLFRQAESTRRSLFDGRASAALLEARATALQAAGARAQEAETAANASNRAKTAFLANVSHEIRTPMVAILAYTEMLMNGELAEDERIPCLAVVHRSSERLLALLNDVLDLARIEGGRLAVRVGRCDLPALLRRIEAVARTMAEEHHVDFRVVLKTPIPASVECDPARLTQMLVNLAGEALKGTGAMGVRLEVRYEAWQARPALWVDVIDEGCGPAGAPPPPADSPDADPWTAPGAPSAGLRFAIAQGLARLLGGDLQTRRDRAACAAFTLRVPLRSLTDAVCADLDVDGEGAGEDRTLEGTRLLLVEGGLSSGPPLASLLREAGATVETVPDEERAVAAAMAASHRKAPYQVVLLDELSPSLDGHMGVARLRAAGYRYGVVALGRSGAGGDREHSLDSGYDDYLERPLDVKRVVELLRCYAGRTSEVVPVPVEVPPLPSTMSDDPLICSLLDRFLDDVAAREHSLQRALDRGDCDAVLRISHVLAGVGGSYGFSELTDAARRLETGARRAQRTEDLRGQVQEVALLCRRMLSARRAGRPDVSPRAGTG
jgi:signal transduction histidine kinase/DNA-binding response OmpR family regulator